MSSEESSHQQAIQARCFHPTGVWREFPPAALEASLVARFEEMVAHYPERLAVQMDDRNLTYAALNEQANRVAHEVLAQPGDQTQPVILLFDHAPIAVVAMLGVLKAGRFYTPFDPTQPAPRLLQKANDSQASLILTDRQHLPLATEVNGSEAAILCIEQLVSAQPTEANVSMNPNLPIDADDHALLLYTSGSTGEAKGILLSHRALLHRVKRQMEIVHLSCEDRCACVHTYDAIAGLRDLFCPLLSGAATCLFNLKVRTLTEFPAWVQQSGITILGFVTPTLRHLLNAIPPTTAFAQVRLLCIGGDTLYRQDVERYRQHFPPTCVLYNSLGATETAGGFCYYLFEHEHLLPADPLPVGYPMLDMQIVIVDEDGVALPNGVIGEIALTTTYLTQGYWRQPAQTTNRFRPASVGTTYLTGDSGLLQADNCLIHLGRKDNQVKLQGYRVEMGEIERNLLTHPAVQEAVVMAHGYGLGESRLVAYWVARPGMVATAQILRQWLLASVPAHMVPARFLLVDALPLTPSGKIDRQALSALSATWPERDPPSQAPRTPTEQTLAQLWSVLLGVEQIGIQDHFFELGGHSMLAVHLLTQIQQHFQRELPLKTFIFNPTIAHLAEKLDAVQGVVEPIMPLPSLAELKPAPSTDTLPKTNNHTTELAMGNVDDARILQQIYEQLGQPHAAQRLRNWRSHEPARSRVERLLRRLPQPLAFSLLRRLVRQPWARQRYWTREITLARRFHEVLDTPVDVACLVENSLFYGLLKRYGFNFHLANSSVAPGLARYTPLAARQAQQPVTQMIGLAHLEAAKRQGRGVILATHHSLATHWLHLGDLTQASIFALDRVIQRTQVDAEKALPILYARQLEVAQQTLRSGGVVSIAPDGHEGRGAVREVVFHGRHRRFHTSFAELALLTGASIIPVLGEIPLGAPITLRLLEPLDLGDETMSRVARLEYLSNQYLAHLDSMWRTMPWVIPWGHMKQHLAS